MAFSAGLLHSLCAASIQAFVQTCIRALIQAEPFLHRKPRNRHMFSGLVLYFPRLGSFENHYKQLFARSVTDRLLFEPAFLTRNKREHIPYIAAYASYENA